MDVKSPMDVIGFLLAYCPLPVFIFLTVYTLGLRDLSRHWDGREFAKNIIRKLLSF
jgi:hypothetical protein